MKQKIFASISGGETSGLMAYEIKRQFNLKPVLVFGSKGMPKYTKHVNDTKEVIFGFMNTSQEDNRTLNFVNKLSVNFGLSITWLEAVINPVKGKGISHRVVNYISAKRDGSVFESHIAKYGLPSSKAPHCTRDLKEGVCNSFLRSIGWLGCTIAIGYRADEPKRVNFIKAKEKNQWYPLFERGIIKREVKLFWAMQSFMLGLEDHEGNCKLCFKKSKRKLLMQILAHPKFTKWYERMQVLYPNDTKGNPTVMFRGKESIFDLIKQALEYQEEIKIGLFDIELDEQENCAESCEVFAN